MVGKVIINMTVKWRSIWMSRWERGIIVQIGTESDIAIRSIHKNTKTGEIRLSTEDKSWPLDEQNIRVNDKTIWLRQRGRFGRLHSS